MKEARESGVAHMTGSGPGPDLRGVLLRAIREGVGLVGILVAMLAGDVSWVLSFALLSVLAQASSWPREDILRKRLRLP